MNICEHGMWVNFFEVDTKTYSLFRDMVLTNNLRSENIQIGKLLTEKELIILVCLELSLRLLKSTISLRT